MIKLFVGCDPNGCDAESQMVLEYTARKRCSEEIDIVWMKHSNDPNDFWNGWNSKTWATPFSGFRWGIPTHCDFEGQAIYMDSDMIILGDLAELWNEPWNDTAIIMGKGGWRFCVAKWNCERAKEVLPPIEQIKSEPYSHQQLAHGLPKHPHLEQIFDRQWNNFDGENDELDNIKILHYTDMSTQPHLKYALPRIEAEGHEHWFDGDVRNHRRADVIELFDKYYNEALVSGMAPQDYYDLNDFVEYEKESQAGYRAQNGFDVTEGQ
jgi:hypothetical protein